MENKIAKCLGALTVVGSGILYSHSSQIDTINEECDELRAKYQYVATDPSAEVREVVSELGVDITEYETGWGFILGDFEIEDGKSRCGGVAAEACRRLSERGFDTQICFEITKWGFHYFAQVSKDERYWRIEGGPKVTGREIE